MPLIDLHLHSAASDGRLSPAELVAEAASGGLSVISLTDHDTVDGIALALEAAEAFPDLTVIPGIELSTEFPRSEVHVLGYFIDYADDDFAARLVSMRNSRLERAREMIIRLGELGVDIEWGRVEEIAGGGSVGRPHLAQAMLEKGYIDSIRGAFDGYLEKGGPAYVERAKLTPEAAVGLIRQVKGLPVLAHPLTIADPELMIAKLAAEGLVGVEVYYKNYSESEVAWLKDLADSHGLIATGGTDYHGLDAEDELMMGSVAVPFEAVARLFALKQA